MTKKESDIAPRRLRQISQQAQAKRRGDQKAIDSWKNLSRKQKREFHQAVQDQQGEYKNTSKKEKPVFTKGKDKKPIVRLLPGSFESGKR